MQKVASEALIAAANKKEKAKGILGQGVHILKKLYQTGADNIKVHYMNISFVHGWIIVFDP